MSDKYIPLPQTELADTINALFPLQMLPTPLVLPQEHNISCHFSPLLHLTVPPQAFLLLLPHNFLRNVMFLKLLLLLTDCSQVMSLASTTPKSLR